MPAVRSRGRVDSSVPKPRSDAYVGLLVISMLALTVAMLFAFLTWNGISEKPAKPVQVAPKGGPAAPAPGGPVNPPPQPGGMQGAPPAGGMQGAPPPGGPQGGQPPAGKQGNPPPAPPAPPAKQ